MRRHLHPPVTLLLLAVVIGAAWGAMHLAGWREHTSAFSVVTLPPGHEQVLVKGVFYAGLHLLLVLAAPVLVLAALVLAVVERRARRRPAA